MSQPLTSCELDSAAQLITTHYRWPDMDLDARQFRDELKGLDNPMLRDVMELFYLKQLEREQKERWGDKTPGYIEIIPELVTLFPDAQFIHCVRDGRDVVKSFQARNWHGPWLHTNAHEWILALECNERWAELGLSQRILQLRYEDLVLETAKTIRTACVFLGEEFEPGMLAWCQAVDRMVPAREAHVHQKLKSAPTPDDVYRWRREMSRREIFVCEAFMGKYLRQFSYEPQFQSRFWAPISGATRLYCRYLLPILALPRRAFYYLKRQVVRRHDAIPQATPLHR
jgi:hypothetical protein